MADGAALLVDHVLPAVGYRQWVLSFGGPMAQRLGYDQALLAEVAGALARAVMHDMRWAVKERHDLGSVEPLQNGCPAHWEALPEDRRRGAVRAFDAFEARRS